MSEESLEFGAEASDRTGPVGQLTRIVLDPNDRTASHVVIVPDDVALTARLVPIGIVDPSSAPLLLRCSRQEFFAFEEAVDDDGPPSSPVADALTMVLTERSGSGAVFLRSGTIQP